MSTRAQVRFATREEGVSFNEHPEKFHAQFYKHHDGYPEGLGINLATTLLGGNSANAVPLEIDSLDTRRGDVEYIYYIWQAPMKTTWISIFETHQYGWAGKNDECIFVGEPSNLIDKYKEAFEEDNDRDYVDYA
mgnify:CR=1 FL=1